MTFDLHHVHLLAADVDHTVDWWCRHLDAEVRFDGELAGARNVFLAVGSGRLHVYAQPPRGGGRNAVHHLGIRVTGLRDAWRRLQAAGVTSPRGLREHDGWRYVMVAAPDGVLLELFEFDDPARLDGSPRAPRDASAATPVTDAGTSASRGARSPGSSDGRRPGSR